MIRLSGLRVGTDIKIEFVGLRPGEKMFEELHAESEQRLPTSHPKIIIAQHRKAQPAELLHAISELERLAYAHPDNISDQLHAIVPEYQKPLITIPFDADLKVQHQRRLAA